MILIINSDIQEIWDCLFDNQKFRLISQLEERKDSYEDGIVSKITLWIPPRSSGYSSPDAELKPEFAALWVKAEISLSTIFNKIIYTLGSLEEAELNKSKNNAFTCS